VWTGRDFNPLNSRRAARRVHHRGGDRVVRVEADVMSQEQEYSIVEPFFIDNGELDGISPQEVFCLGVEWQMVAAQEESDEAFERLLHEANATRIKRLLIRRGRKFKVTPNGPEWCMLSVEPK
jgi:hypothetical protein